MEKEVKGAKTEKVLLALTSGFLCVLLVMFFHDRQKMDAPLFLETETEVPQSAFLPELPPEPSPVNLNTATEEELTALKQVGPTLARRIVEYRETTGGFDSVEELLNIPGIGERNYTEIADDVTVR